MELSITSMQQIFAILSTATTSRLHLNKILSWLSESLITKPWASFLNKKFKGADTKSQVDGDGDFDEEFFVEEIRKYPCIWDTKCRSYIGGTKKQNAWSQLCQLFNKEGRLMFSI